MVAFGLNADVAADGETPVTARVGDLRLPGPKPTLSPDATDVERAAALLRPEHPRTAGLFAAARRAYSQNW